MAALIAFFTLPVSFSSASSRWDDEISHDDYGSVETLLKNTCVRPSGSVLPRTSDGVDRCVFQVH